MTMAARLYLYGNQARIYWYQAIIHRYGNGPRHVQGGGELRNTSRKKCSKLVSKLPCLKDLEHGLGLGHERREPFPDDVGLKPPI